MLNIDKQNQLISSLKEIHKKNENYILQNNFLLYLKPSNINKKKDNLLIDLYDKENCISNLPPHIYDIAKTALIRTLVLNKDVSIIFNGNSQSGKTYNIYKCLEYFSMTSFNKNKNFNCNVIDSINVMIENLCCIDSITEIPILYKINVSLNGISGIEFNRILSNGYNKLICFNKNTKNFNIFYTVFYGIEENKKEKFGLQNKKFFLLNDIILNAEEKEYCKNQFNKLKYSMIEVLGFTEEHYKTFVQIICAILNIGNISFYIDTNSDDQIVKICQKPELLIISELLEIPNTELFNIFNYKNYDNSIEKALYLRDQLIEMLYIKLIDWVLMRIQNIYDNKSNSSIYIFDYKGYTSSGYNEYDEFCTNITNEIHMNLFLSKYMEYYLNNNKIEENIILTKKINESCLNLLINGKENLLGTLNDECVFPLTSTSTLIKKFDLNFIDQNCYLNSRTKKSLEFGIKHFFGVQYYNVTDFLLQNKRMTNKSSDEIFLKSQNSTIISMFSGKNCSYEERTCNKFVATEIVNSLNKNVISKLLLTEMLFICCLKPSLKKNSEDFDSNLMTKQLKSQGLLDLLKIETNNFNHHYYISQFLKIFNILLPINCTEKCNDVQNVQNIFNKQHNKFRNDYIILDKKVYLTEYLAKNLEWKKYDHTLKCIIKIQTLFRRQIERKNFLLKKKAAIKIQSLFRGWKGRQIVSILRTQIKEKMITENVTQNNGICKYLIKSISTNIPSQIVEENINLNLEFENNYVKISNTQDVLPILQIPIENFAKKYIKYHQLGVKREAIFSPFLEKDNENDYSKSLKLFKLILEYMLSESDDNLLIKNITETVINNTKLKDEIYIQILNQTYNNSSKKEKNKIWILFFVILNSFLPSNNLFPVLIDYFIIQKQPIQILFNETFYRHLSISQQQSYCRRYPSITTYEMITFTKKYPLCIKINISKMCILSIQIDSLSTIKEIIKNCLEKININNVNGWNINMEVLKNKLLIKLEEKDYYFDIIYMIENDMINNIKEEKITYPTNIKRLKNNKKESSTLGTQLENEKNKIIKNKKTNDGNVKQTDKINDLILSPKTLRRIFILNSNELTENPENEDKKISDNNNNSSINQLKIYDKNYSSNIDENGNNIECFNIPTKDIEKNIYSLPKYMPIMEVDDDVQDMIDDIFYDSISENKDTNLIKSSIEKKLIKNIQGGLLKENSNEKCTYVPYKEQYKDIYDLETSSSLNTMSSSKMSSNCDKNYNNTNSKMAVNKMELQKLINLEEIESSTCGNDNISKTINYLKSKDAIIIPLNLYNITLRKEIFYPYEILDKYEIDLIYLQIINDCKENNPYCIEKKERDSINKILRYNKISLHDINEPEKLPYKTKEEIVNCARGWPLYFSKVYFVTKIKDNIFQKCQLHISENGIYVVEVQLNFETNPYIITDKIFYDEISDTYFEDENNFYIYLYNNTHLKFSTQKKSEEIQGIINKFLNPILEKPIYLHTIAPFLSNNSELLSFDKGDQIQIINDNYYHKSTIPNYGNGWLFGKCHNSVGWFSTDYVSMTPTEDSSYVTPYFDYQQFDDNDVIYESNIETYSMAEFAINFFQKQKRGTEIGTLFRKKDKDWTWKDISNLIKYSSKPITSSLLLLNSNELQKGSVDTFMCIMRYMGDENLKKNQTITDCVYELLTICKENPPLHDEVYCQMMKQLTSNTSKIEDSLLKGWRLFTIITSYFTTSDILKPYLINFLKLIAFDKNRSCHQTAMTCLKNFEQTLKYGGRKLLLSASEVEAITKGKYVKRQAYLLPGGHKMFINTTISTVAENLIKHICCEMNIFSLKEQQEFSLCYLIENENNMEIISNNEYILDITTKMTLEKKKIMLVLKRFVWISPLRFDNNLLIDVMFYQILPDYISGLYMTNCDKKSLTIKDLNSLSLMGALIHYSDSIGKATTVKSDCIDSLIPSIILKKYSKITLNDWANRIMKKINEWNFEMTTIYAKSLFLITLQKYYLFSGTFYHIKKVIKNGTSINELIDGILAINKNGLTFLDKENRNIIFKINFDEIDFTDFYPQDYKLSIITTLNNMITLMADAGDDITKIIHHYMYIYKF